MIYSEVIGVCWLAFFLSWIVLAAKFGRRTRSQYFSVAGLGLRLLIAVALIASVMYGNRGNLEPGSGGALVTTTGAIAAAGAALCVIGLAFAIWARVTLGANWGMPQTVHEDPELVTSGPYRFVRHPIYTAIGTMFIGTALVHPFAAIPAAAVIAYTVFSARREERDMAQKFPDAYAKYRQRSKFLVPFLL
jgi:protein-S-isoprenylcysteine O-methyltransferase Ste14